MGSVNEEDLGNSLEYASVFVTVMVILGRHSDAVFWGQIFRATLTLTRIKTFLSMHER